MTSTMSISAVVTATMSNHTNNHVISDMSDMSSTSNGAATPPGQREEVPSRYRHIAAVHSRARTSCLSHDSEFAPSFLGFRNLMVLVLSK